MYIVPFKDVQTALAAQILERLSKGEALDPAACSLYGTLAAHDTHLAEKEGDAALYKTLGGLAYDKLNALFDRAEALVKTKQTPPRPQADSGIAWQPRTPVERALEAMQKAQQALAQNTSDEAQAVLAADVAETQRALDEAMRAHLAEKAKTDVLYRQEQQLIDEIAKQRMHGGSRERMAALEQQLLQTKLELYAVHRNVWQVAPVAVVGG